MQFPRSSKRHDHGRPAAWLIALALAFVSACDFGGTRNDGGAAFDLAKALVRDGGTDAGVPEGCSFEAPVSCPSPAPTWAADIRPIIDARCLPGCHDGTTSQWPLATYKHVADWQNEIRDRLFECNMPPPDAGVPMTVDERIRIMAWIRCGLPQ